MADTEQDTLTIVGCIPASYLTRVDDKLLFFTVPRNKYADYGKVVVEKEAFDADVKPEQRALFKHSEFYLTLHPYQGDTHADPAVMYIAGLARTFESPVDSPSKSYVPKLQLHMRGVRSHLRISTDFTFSSLPHSTAAWMEFPPHLAQ